MLLFLCTWMVLNIDRVQFSCTQLVGEVTIQVVLWAFPPATRGLPAISLCSISVNIRRRLFLLDLALPATEAAVARGPLANEEVFQRQGGIYKILPVQAQIRQGVTVPRVGVKTVIRHVTDADSCLTPSEGVGTQSSLFYA